MQSTADKKRLWLRLFFIIVALIALGFLRDSTFKTINALLRSWDLEQDYFLPSFLSFLEKFEYDTLVNLKWILTVGFSLVYLIVAIQVIRLLFANKQFVRITIFTYLLLLVISGVFIFIGMIVKSTAETMYEFSRFLMGMAQSPLVLMILIPAFKLSEKEINKTKEI